MISVVVPVYNVEKYITKCLESIIRQSYKDFELLLVNDGSTDKSVEIINECLLNSNLNWKLINKENGGLASARNTGIKEAKGDYVSFIDADDCVSDDFLYNLINAIEKDDYDFSFCAFQYIKDQSLTQDKNENTQIFDRDTLLLSFLKRNISFVVPSMFFKKNFLIENNLFFDEDIKFSEDQPFIWNVILHSNKTIYLYKKMYGYYIRENSIMTSSSYTKIENSYKEFSEYIFNLFNKFPQYKKVYDFIIPRWQLGTLYTSARILNYDEFVNLYNLFDGKTLFKRVKNIGEKKAYALSFVTSFSSKLLYSLCNRMNLNK